MGTCRRLSSPPMRVEAGLFAIVAGCYQPHTPEHQPCTDKTNLCPPDQTCSLMYHECARLPLCETPAISDDFESGMPCAPSGNTVNVGRDELTDGHLV